MLEEGRQRTMTLISAPAGYGKSILASQWLEASQCRSAWLSLDQGENDLRLFLRYLLEAIQHDRFLRPFANHLPAAGRSACLR